MFEMKERFGVKVSAYLKLVNETRSILSYIDIANILKTAYPNGW